MHIHSVALYLSYISLFYRFEDKLVVAAGKGDPASVMSEYGFK
jgi:hypothetical protein